MSTNVGVVKYARGTVWECLISTQDSEPGIQCGTRPVVIISEDVYNYSSQAVNVLVMTRKQKQNAPTNLPINFEGETSTIIVSQPRPVNKTSLVEYKGRLDDRTLEELRRRMICHYGLGNPGDLYDTCDIYYKYNEPPKEHCKGHKYVKMYENGVYIKKEPSVPPLTDMTPDEEPMHAEPPRREPEKPAVNPDPLNSEPDRTFALGDFARIKQNQNEGDDKQTLGLVGVKKQTIEDKVKGKGITDKIKEKVIEDRKTRVDDPNKAARLASQETSIVKVSPDKSTSHVEKPKEENKTVNPPVQSNKEDANVSGRKKPVVHTLEFAKQLIADKANMSPRELADKYGYKNPNSIYSTIAKLKGQYNLR